MPPCASRPRTPCKQLQTCLQEGLQHEVPSCKEKLDRRFEKSRNLSYLARKARQPNTNPLSLTLVSFRFVSDVG